MREIKLKHDETPMPISIPRKIVQIEQFFNQPQDKINEFLSKFPAEDIVSTHYFVRGDGDISDEFVGVFYKTYEH